MAKNKNIFIHPSSYLGKDVEIGKNTKIWHFCHIMKGARIGENCILGQNIFVGENVTIGDNVKIQNNVSIFSGIEIKNNVFIGPSVTFTNVKKPRTEYPVKKRYSKTVIRKGATLGANSTIICGLNIGEYSFVGAGALVTKDVINNALVFGNPAKQKGFICQCGTKLVFKGKKSKCKRCNKQYIKRNSRVSLCD